MTDTILLNDKEVARRLSLSAAWVRGQRWKRRGGKPHSFDLNPVMIGTTPRYKMVDVEAWIDRLAAGNQPSDPLQQAAQIQQAAQVLNTDVAEVYDVQS
jgi:hypothetical protein